MDYFIIIAPKLISFFLLIALGFTISKLGIFPKSCLPSLSAFLLKVVLPCLTVSLLCERGTTWADLAEFHGIVLCQMAGYVLLALAGLLCIKLVRIRNRRTANVHVGCMIGGNYGFVVIPILMALYTPENGQQYIPICSAIDTMMVWTLGLYFFTRGIEKESEPWYRILFKRLFNPILVSIVLILTLNSLAVTLPNPVLEVCTNVGNISYSLGLIYVGSTICFLKKGSLGCLKTLWILVLAKLFVVPLVIYTLTGPLLSETERIVLMLIAGAPSMTTSCMIAGEYGLDEDYASTAVFVTTISCMVTIPLLFLSTGWIP